MIIHSAITSKILKYIPITDAQMKVLDSTVADHPEGKCCMASRGGWGCTRDLEHPGPHIAHGDRTLAIWMDEPVGKRKRVRKSTSRMTRHGWVLDTYLVEIPEDIEEPERGDLAINEARERARLYVLPCNWLILNDDGLTVTVGRIRYKKGGGK